MAPITVPNRPFATDMITGLMLPDGVFEASIGNQWINAHFTNAGAATVANLNVYIESVSNPGIVVQPQTHVVSTLASGAAVLLDWAIDVSGCPPGEHLVSFIADAAGVQRRVIKKIFVTRVLYNPASKTFSAVTPQ